MSAGGTAAAVAVVGSFNVDHVWSTGALPVPGETRSASYACGAGGKGFNQAVAAARAGARPCFVCALGADAGGQLARALAVADGIDLRDATSVHPTGAAGIFVDAGGRNCIAVAAGANGDLQPGHVAHALDTGAPAVVLAQLETPAPAALAAFGAGRRHGALNVLNPAPADARIDDALLALIDVLTPNETEFTAMLARHAGASVAADDVAGLDDAGLHALCRRLLPHGTVVVTLGAAGCFVSHGDDRRGDAQACYRAPARQVRTVDTTGAGDAFNGALCARLATGGGPFAAQVAWAAAYASLSTERHGAAASMPAPDEMRLRFPDLA